MNSSLEARIQDLEKRMDKMEQEIRRLPERYIEELSRMLDEGLAAMPSPWPSAAEGRPYSLKK